jgi:hypothetical protein
VKPTPPSDQQWHTFSVSDMLFLCGNKIRRIMMFDFVIATLVSGVVFSVFVVLVIWLLSKVTKIEYATTDALWFISLILGFTLSLYRGFFALDVLFNLPVGPASSILLFWLVLMLCDWRYSKFSLGDYATLSLLKKSLMAVLVLIAAGAAMAAFVYLT